MSLRTTAKTLMYELAKSGLEVSRKTVSRTCKRNGLHGCRPSKTPLLKKRHLQARLKFARDKLDKGEAYWKSVIWSDETKLEFGHGDDAYPWRRKGQTRPLRRSRTRT